MGKFTFCLHSCFGMRLCVCNRWKDIGTIAHNKSAITVEITSRDDTINFHMVGVVSAGSPRHIQTQNTFYKVERSIHRRHGKEKYQRLLQAWFAVNKVVNVLFLCVWFSAGGYGNGQVHCSSFHGQTQILQTEQNLHRVSLKLVNGKSCTQRPSEGHYSVCSL